ncbi:DUF2975 domain-containing protein [Aeromicrobium sp. CF3.5]|uniref:DUF2975 domain-containing protein n=1 Tax=Aeromicrobium sp. CF3.5 TaxID=3373078 RepID=UPI003EE5C6E8
MFDDQTYQASTSDRRALQLFAVLGAVIAVIVTWRAIARIIEVLPNRDVTVTGVFEGTPATAPIGPAGESVGVELQRATLTVPSLPAASLGSVVIGQVLLAVGVTVIVACLIGLTRELAAGRIFSTLSTRLVTVASVMAVVTYAGVPFFDNMAANGAFARLSDRTFDNAPMAADLTGLVVAGFGAALASTVFAIGNRIRRDAEGLI